jgi:hypothetical protein
MVNDSININKTNNHQGRHFDITFISVYLKQNFALFDFNKLVISKANSYLFEQ